MHSITIGTNANQQAGAAVTVPSLSEAKGRQANWRRQANSLKRLLTGGKNSKSQERAPIARFPASFPAINTEHQDTEAVMTAIANHTIDSAHPSGYGRCRALAVWISAVHEGQRVVLFPCIYMGHKLPVAEIDGNRFTIDDRLMELRNEERPYEDVVRFDDMDTFISYVSRLRIVQPFLDYDRERNQFVPTRTFDRFDYLPSVSN